MPKHPSKRKAVKKAYSLPIVIEKDEDGYVVECPVLPGCYSQGDSLDEAMANIQEVIELIAGEEDCKKILRGYQANNVSFHVVSLTLE
jgi:predicted RNase H-like HicB family nuclease